MITANMEGVNYKMARKFHSYFTATAVVVTTVSIIFYHDKTQCTASQFAVLQCSSQCRDGNSSTVTQGNTDAVEHKDHIMNDTNKLIKPHYNKQLSLLLPGSEKRNYILLSETYHHQHQFTFNRVPSLFQKQDSVRFP